MSSTDATLLSRALMASIMYGISRRLTTKPELSFARIGSLPRARMKSIARVSVSSLVVIVRTTSTSFINGTGLKKCKPSIRSARPLAVAIAMIVRLDVLEAKIASGRASSFRSDHRVFLTDRSSTTASMKTSLSASWSSSVTKRRFPSVVSRSSVVTLPRSIPLARVFSIDWRDFAQRSADTSRTVVGKPAAAHTWAMPLPIRPPPITPTFLIFSIQNATSLVDDPRYRCRERDRTNLSSRQTRSRRDGAEQSGWPVELAVLEPVENLLEGELHARQHRAMGARHPICRESSPGKWQDCGAGGEKERQMHDCESEPNYTACQGADRGDEATDSDATRAAGVDIGVESDYYSRRVDRQDRCRHLAGIHQVESAPADVHCSAELAEQSALRLPGDALGEAALDLEALLAQHPRIYGCENVARIAWYGASGGGEPGAGDLRDEPALFRNVDPRALFRERLIYGRGAEADFVANVEELAFADRVARFRKRAGSLQLGGAGEH